MTLRFSTLMLIGSLMVVCGLFGPGVACAGPHTESAVTATDTVPSNLWLTRSLMEDLVRQCADVLGPESQNILLQGGGDDPGSELFQAAVHKVLTGLGHHVFLATAVDDTSARFDVNWNFKVAGVKLAYPQVGRTLGIWRSWIARELEITVFCTLTEIPSGRILLDDQMQMRFNDRFAVDDLVRVDSPLYDFTTAEPINGSWHNRLEEIVVLGTLAGLVAVYFANTSN